MHKFVRNIVAFSLKNHILILFLTGMMTVAGAVCYLNTPVEAYPDVTNTRARIITQWPGRSAEEVEKFITLPVMRAMNTIPRKVEVRSVSLFGLSVVTVIFDDGVDDFFAQQYASNRLQELDLPAGASSGIEPPSGATGEIYRYVLKSKRHIRETSSINTWVVERELLAVPGVASVVSFGGEEKIYEIRVNPVELNNYRLSPLEVYEAVSRSNINVGGDVIQKGSQAYVVRGIGLLESIEDIENILIEVKGSTPVRIKQVATVSPSSMPRLGRVGLDDEDDLVQGIVIMLRGQNPGEVIKNLKNKIDDLNERILPKDIKIQPFLDRTTLVDATVRTVSRNLLEGIILVSCIVFLFLFNWRTTLIVASVIPMSFLFAVMMLRIQGLPANLISMGALDFGLLLEGALIIVERIFVEMEQKSKELGIRYNKVSKSGLIKKSAGEVASYIFFAQIILVVALIPIFSFQKVEGKMFSPLAFTLGYALLGSLILSLSYVPVMCKLILTKAVEEKRNLISKFFIDGLTQIYDFSVKNKKAVIISFCVLLTICTLRFIFYGSEFIPKLNEGALYVRATLPNSINLDESVRLTKEMKAELRKFDEVQFILSQTGRPNDGTDPTGFFNAEFHIQLKPENEWQRRIGKEQLIDELKATLEKYPGVNFGFSQPIQDNVEEYVAGVKSSLVVKLFGNDLFRLEEMADEVAEIIQDVRGVEDVNVFRSLGLPELQIKLDEARMARYAVSMADAQAVVEMAIGGKAATKFYEDERTFDVRLRFQEEYRDSEDKIANILIPAMDGKRVPLKEIASIHSVTGPAFIYREGGSRYVGVGFGVRDRDLGSVVAEAQKKVKDRLKQSPDTEVEIRWAGEFESKERATNRLIVIMPAVLFLILFLLYMNFGTVKDTLIAASAIPYAFIGGFVSLWITGTVFGISAGVGFIILFGITAVNSILLIAVIKSNIRTAPDLKTAIRKAVISRLRPVLMISLMGSTGLLPAALSHGMGSEIQKPLAIMITGGMIICMMLSISVLPQVFYYAYKKSVDR